MPATWKNFSGMARFDKYSLPQAGDIFSNGNIGRIEHLIDNIGMPVTGGSIAIIADLELLNWMDHIDIEIDFKWKYAECDVPAFINPLQNISINNWFRKRENDEITGRHLYKKRL